MWKDSKLAKVLNIPLPLIQAPMAGAAHTELMSAVCNAGALGSLGAGYMQPEAIRVAIHKIKKFTNQPFNINLFIPAITSLPTENEIEEAKRAVQAACTELNFEIPNIQPPFQPNFDDQMQVLLEEKVPIFSFTFGIPSTNWIEKFHKNNTILIGTATSVAEAIALEKAGIDLIVAQGSEAGGHRGTFIGEALDSMVKLHMLLTAIIENVHIPVIASGGIMDAQGISLAFSLGAAGVQMGTAFLTCHESTIHSAYKERLLQLTSDQTVLTNAFSGKYARGLNNKFIQNMETKVVKILPYPIQNALTTKMRTQAALENNPDYLSMWAGQSAHLCKSLSVLELIRSIDLEMNATK